MNGTTMLTSRIRCLLALLSVCCVLGFVSCSNGEEGIDDVLSKETTPVTFELGSGNHILFDYTANGTYVDSDTINLIAPNTTATIKLRQGKHQCIMMNGLRGGWPVSEDDICSLPGVHFVPKANVVIFNRDEQGHDGELKYHNYPVFYWKKQIDVSPYLLPTQRAEYIPVSCMVLIEATDNSVPSVFEAEGTITGIPIITKVGLEDNRYGIINETATKGITFRYVDTVDETDSGFIFDTFIYANAWFYSLCPQNGLDNIQLGTKIQDGDGNIITTTPLPKISFRRGYTTKLTGPLFSGSTADWKIEMIPFGNDK